MWPFRRKTDDKSRRLGPRGEALAARLLKKQGLKILARNYRCPAGEADIIALDTSTRRKTGAETIVFVEVKARNTDAYVAPHAAVDSDKQRRLRGIARYYMSVRPTAGFALRFDVVSVVAPPGQEPKLTHLPDAF